MNPLAIFGRLGDSTPVPPTSTGSSGKRKVERPSFDADELARRALVAENNARAAVILGIIEGDDL